MSAQNYILSGIGALANPSPFAYANLISTLLTGQGILANVAPRLGISGNVNPLAGIISGGGRPPVGGGGITSIPMPTGSPLFPTGGPAMPSVVPTSPSTMPFIPDAGGPRFGVDKPVFGSPEGTVRRGMNF